MHIILHLGYHAVHVRILPYEKENKASSGAEDNAKSAEVGTREAGSHLTGVT